ncbi:MAG: site-2 protease family protein [Chloroflexota bacterium]|nr:site-2 protease family protein [Chloroflexota bacterium]
MVARGSRGGPFGGGNALPWLVLLFLAYAFLVGGVASPIRNASSDPVGFAAFLIAIVLGVTVHEFMHAYTAHRFGDDTGRLLGRMTLDPRAHFDLWGSLLIVFLGFGYGKPVPVNESRLSPGRLGMALVSLAGPLTNFVLAAVAAIPLRFGAGAALGTDYERILLTIVEINCLLGVFNLLPVPPLDGSNVVYGLLPPREAWTWRSYQQYGLVILLAILFFLPYLGVDVITPLVVRPGQAIASFFIGGGFP